MTVSTPANRPWIKSILLGGAALFFAISLVIFPEAAFQSSLEGLKIWWEVVFPALLPFFIASEILMGFGVVHLFGVLLEPLMRPVFRVPGAGAFVMAMGLASGNPIGAKLTARLREQRLITRSEGERLVSFTNTVNPLFMFGAVAVGFFHDASLGVTLVIAHYSASLMVGLIMRFHDRDGASTPPLAKSREFFLVRAIKAMHDARLNDGRSLGTLIGDAVVNSVNTLLMVGGFIIIFSVLIQVMTTMHITTILSHLFGLLLVPLGFSADLASPLIPGLFEITLGAKTASGLRGSAATMHVLAVTSAIIAWSGLCVHAQVASLLSSTDIRYTPYMFARFMHGMFACLMTLVIWHPVNRYLLTSDAAIPAFLNQIPENSFSHMWMRLEFIGVKLLLFLLILTGLAILLQIGHSLVRKDK